MKLESPLNEDVTCSFDIQYSGIGIEDNETVFEKVKIIASSMRYYRGGTVFFIINILA